MSLIGIIFTVAVCVFLFSAMLVPIIWEDPDKDLRDE